MAQVAIVLGLCGRIDELVFTIIIEKPSKTKNLEGFFYVKILI
jgi:hypothetical protein